MAEYRQEMAEHREGLAEGTEGTEPGVYMADRIVAKRWAYYGKRDKNASTSREEVSRLELGWNPKKPEEAQTNPKS